METAVKNSIKPAALSHASLLVVAVALVDVEGRVLLQQRPQGKPMAGLWEFPGGKIEAGETPEQALIRELDEELGIVVASPLPATFASAPLGDRHLLLLLYICRDWRGEPQPREAQALRWVAPADMNEWPMPEADYPLIAPLVRLLASGAQPIR